VPRTCSVCTHPAQSGLDADLIAGIALSALSAKHTLSEDALSRHRANHIPALLAKAEAAPAVADDLLGQVRDLQSRTMTILGTAEQAGELKIALAAIREARGCLELLAKLTGELAQEGTVNILIAPEWLALRGAILTALAPYAEARAAVAGALLRLDGGTA
jgi:hypothetical protein